MGASRADSAIAVPAELFSEYLATTGLATQLALTMERRDARRLSLEQLLDLSLEAEHLFTMTPFTEQLEDRLIAVLDALDYEAVVRVRAAWARWDTVELIPAPRQTGALEAVRMGWSRVCSPTALQTPAAAVSIELELVNQRSLPPHEQEALGRRWEQLPHGERLEVAPSSLQSVIDRLADTIASGESSSALGRYAVFARYALGATYNRVMRPREPFEFVELVAPTGERAGELRSAFSEFGPVLGMHDAEAAVDLAVRGYVLEQRLLSSTKLWNSADTGEAIAANETGGSMRSVSGPTADAPVGNPAVAAQQLTGAPAAPGRVTGIVRRAGDLAADNTAATALGLGTAPADGAFSAPSLRGTVLACDRFGPVLLDRLPEVVAVVERDGSRIGFGALQARTARLPCVSGVSDLELLNDGTVVSVDGDLGLVTVEHGRSDV